MYCYYPELSFYLHHYLLSPHCYSREYAGAGHHPLWWALSLGACLGGNLTIIGAAANVIVSETAHTKGHPISFIKFMKYGALVTTVSLIISSIYLYIKYLR